MRIQGLILTIFIILPLLIFGQAYTSYHTGNTNDTLTHPESGICLMGGAAENEEAMRWFLKKANGGDVLVLRASGSDGYNNFMYSKLGVSLHSVESIVFHDRSASFDPTILQKIKNAEAIWLAGGDQWKYVSYWRNTPVDSLINDAIKNRNIPIGGTSAGMAVLGGLYFSAENNTVTSEEALLNPYHVGVTVDSTKFFQVPILSNVITDTHYSNRNRKGRHIVFLARILTDYGIQAKGIACDEQVAVCIEPTGIATIFGNFPKTENKAYFIQINHELPEIYPEKCLVAQPLTWNRNGKILKVYSAYGTMDGNHTFDLGDWKTGIGGEWENWSVEKGVLNMVKEK